MLHEMAGFLRWRLKPGRWAAKGIRSALDMPRRMTETVPPIGETSLLEAMRRQGYAKLNPHMQVPRIDLTALAGRALGKSFVDVAADHQDLVTQVFADLLGDPDIASMVAGYFDGRPWLWNLALNYSDPSQAITDSQMWHFDYGDTRQLHLLVYFSDVGRESGPFTFLESDVSERIVRHPLVIERLPDGRLEQEYGIDLAARVTRLVGRRGDCFAADPGRLLHQGARCSQPRLVMFITFSTRTPMSSGAGHTISARERKRLGEALFAHTPDSVLPRSAFG